MPLFKPDMASFANQLQCFLKNVPGHGSIRSRPKVFKYDHLHYAPDTTRMQKRFDDAMQLSKEELIQLLKEQKDLELVAVKSYSSFAEKSNNNVVKLLLLGVMHDSVKHAQVLDALISLTQSPIFGNVEQFEVTRGVEEHLKIEEEMLRKISEIIERTDDSEVKAILSQIAMEEKRHHQTLLELKEMVQKIKRVTEDELWDYLNRWANFST